MDNEDERTYERTKNKNNIYIYRIGEIRTHREIRVRSQMICER